MRQLTTDEKRQAVMAILTEKGWSADRWGNFHHSARPDIRYKLGKLTLKKQARHSQECGGKWFNVKSTYYGKMKVFNTPPFTNPILDRVFPRKESSDV